MSNEHQSHNSLFFVCPFSHTEHFIRSRFADGYFITAPGSVFDFNDETLANEISAFLKLKEIEQIYIVCDVNCSITANLLLGGKAFGLWCEAEILALLNPSDNGESVAGKIIQHEINKMRKTKSIADVISQQNVEIRGIITSVTDNRLVTV